MSSKEQVSGHVRGPVLIRIGLLNEGIYRAAASMPDGAFNAEAREIGAQLTGILIEIAGGGPPINSYTWIERKYDPHRCRWCWRECNDQGCGAWMCEPPQCDRDGSGMLPEGLPTLRPDDFPGIPGWTPEGPRPPS